MSNSDTQIKMIYHFNDNIIRTKSYAFNIENIKIDLPFIEFDLNDSSADMLSSYIYDIEQTKKYIKRRENKMISADEARKLQNELNSNEEEETQLKEVEEKIKKDIKKGYTYYYKQLCPTVKIELEKLGYKISYNYDQRDGSLTTIKW